MAFVENIPSPVRPGTIPPNNGKPQGLSLFGNALVSIGAAAFPNNDNASLMTVSERPRPNNDRDIPK